MINLLFFLIAITFSLSKPHRTVVSSARSFNQPLQATVSFTGTVCASCEQSDTCTSESPSIDSVTLVVNGTEQSTIDLNEDGTFTLSLAEGETTLEVTATCPYANGTASDETASSTQTVTVVSGQPASAEFSLQCTSLCVLTVPVVVQVCAGCNETTGCSEEGAELLSGRMMALYPVENGTDMPTSTIDAEGNGTFDSVVPGDYYVQVYDEPYGSSTIEVAGQITVEDGDPELSEQETQYFGTLIIPNATLCEDPAYLAGRVCADCTAAPPAEGEIANGTVTEESQCATPLVNATVRLTVVAENGTEVSVETVTDELGFYQLEPANLTGNYTLEITADECASAPATPFAQVTGEINATAEPPRVEVNVSAFCIQLCTANITGRVYSAENDTANYTEGITQPLAGITVQLESDADTLAIVGTAVTDEEGNFAFLFVPFGDYTITAFDVPSTGGVTREGCTPTLNDISVALTAETNTTYNVSLVSVQECNNASVCGQILFSAIYCTNTNTTENSTDTNSTLPFTVSFNATNCTCQSNISIVPPMIPPCMRPGQFPPPPPPPFAGGEIERLWRAFLLGTNYPTASQPEEEEKEEKEEKETLSLNNQRILPPRIPAMCPPPCPPPFPPRPNNNTRTCTCTAQGSVSSCFRVVAPIPSAVVRVMRVAEDNTLYQTLAETAVLPNGSFCFTGLPEGENYMLEIVVSENDTLNLEQSNISDAYGAITSTVVTQDGAYPPTQQVISFGPLSLTGADEESIPPFVAVFENEDVSAAANVTIASLNFTQIPTNDTSENSTNSTCPSQMRYVDPWGATYPRMHPLSSPSSSVSPQRVRRTQKKTAKKPQPVTVRTTPAQPSSIAIVRPHPTAPQKSKQTLTHKPKQTHKHTKHNHKSTTHTKRVSSKSGSSSSTVVTRRK